MGCQRACWLSAASYAARGRQVQHGSTVPVSAVTKAHTVCIVLHLLTWSVWGAVCAQAAVRGLMSREHQMLTWHTIAGDLEAKQQALAVMDKSKVRCWVDRPAKQLPS